jgi:hypothetical protein
MAEGRRPSPGDAVLYARVSAPRRAGITGNYHYFRSEVREPVPIIEFCVRVNIRGSNYRARAFAQMDTRATFVTRRTVACSTPAAAALPAAVAAARRPRSERAAANAATTRRAAPGLAAACSKDNNDACSKDSNDARHRHSRGLLTASPSFGGRPDRSACHLPPLSPLLHCLPLRHEACVPAGCTPKSPRVLFHTASKHQ